MKNKNKNKLKIIAISTLLTGVLGVTAIAPKYIKQTKAENENVVNINSENKKLVTYYDASTTIILTADEVSTYTFENLYNYLSTNNYWQYITLYYDYGVYDYFNPLQDNSNNIYAYRYNWLENGASQGVIDFVVNPETYANDIGEGSEQYAFYDDESDRVFSLELSIETSEDYYAGLKSAIELDIQANEPTSMGEQIIETIGSGLGLIGDLANEFLTGFTTLFYNTTTQQLTDFAVFSLIMLGVAVSFAVIKLVLAIVRNNTGA